MRHELRMRIKYIDCCDTQEDSAGACTGMPGLVGTCNRSGTAGECTLKSGRAKRIRV